MWPFKTHKKASVDPFVSGEFVDWHSHLLPGVDDGLKSMDETLAALDIYESEGVKEIWLTPHIMEDIPNKTEDLLSRFSELKDIYRGSVNMNLAAEYMLDTLFEERFSKNDLLTLGDNRLLVETSYFNPPIALHATLKKIKDDGYIPVLAHPERYLYMDKSQYKQLKDMGILFQLNISSLSGGYGKKIKEKANWLLNQNFYDLSGTDTHRVESLKNILKATKK